MHSIQQWPTPTNVKQLRGFLGLASYYRRFIRDYGHLAHSLTDLTKKDAFRWTMEAEDAFRHLKQALSSAPVLQAPDFSCTFVVECDASSEGIGAVLLQNDHPVAFFSKGLSSHSRFHIILSTVLFLCFVPVPLSAYLLCKSYK